MIYPDLITIPVGYSAAVTVSGDVAGTGMTGLSVRNPDGQSFVALTVPQVVRAAVAMLDQTPGAWQRLADLAAARAGAEAVAA